MSSSAGGSSYSGTTNAGRKALLDRKKDQGFTVYWNQVFRPALIETMVAVNKEVENDILVLFECLVEFLQSIAFAFIYNTWWGTSGNMFGRVVAYSEIASVLEYEIHSVEPYYALVTAIFLLVAMLLGSFAYVVMSFITRNFKAGVWPLRILRTLVFILTGFMYIPTITVCLQISHINDNDPHLFPEGAGVALSVISGVVLVVFIPFVLFMSLVHFNPTPKSASLTARSSSRLELIEKIFKTTIVILTVLRPEILVTRLVIMTVGNAALAVFVLLLLPYYSKMMNLIRFLSFFVCTWTGILGLILAILQNDSIGDAIFITLGCGAIILIVCGVFFFNWFYAFTTRNFYRNLMPLLSTVKMSQSSIMIAIPRESVTARPPGGGSPNFQSDEAQANYQTDQLFVQQTINRFPSMNLHSHFAPAPLPPPSSDTMNRSAKNLVAMKKKDATQNDQARQVLLGSMMEALQTKRLLIPVQADVCTRFLVDTEKPSKDELLIAEAIYHHSLNQFERSPQMFLQIGIFYGMYMKEPLAWRFYLQQALDSHPPLDVELAIKLSDVERRRRSQEDNGKDNQNTRLDVVDQIELKLQLKRIKTITADLEENLIQMWRTLMLNKVDLKKLEKVTKKVAAREEQGNTIFDSLLSRFNDNVMVLDAYGAFLEITEVYSLADFVYQRIDQISPLGDHAHNLSDTSLGKELTVKPKFKKDGVSQSEASLQGSNVAPSIQSGSGIKRRQRPLSRSQIHERISHRNLVNHIKSTGTSRLAIVLKLFVLVIFGLLIAQMLWGMSSLDAMKDRLSQIVLGGKRREFAVEIPLKLREMEFAAQRQDAVIFWTAQDRIFNDTIESFKIQNQLFFKADETHDSYQLWLKPWVKLQFYIGKENGSGSNIYWDNPLNLYDSTSEFNRHSRTAANHSFDFFTSGNSIIDESYRYVLDNSPFTMGEAYNEATFQYTLENEQDIRKLTTTLLIVIGVIGGVLIVIGLLLFLPAVNQVFDDASIALKALLAIPKSIIEEEYSRLVSAKNNAKQSQKADSTAEDDEQFEEDSADITLRNDFESGRKMKNSLHMQWISSLFTIFVILAAVTLTSYFQLTSMIESGRRLDLTLRIRYISMRLAFSTQEIAIGEFSPLHNESALRKWIEIDRDSFNAIQFALLFGDPNLGLSPGRLPLSLNETMFYPRWENPPRSTDETVNVYLQDIQSILANKTIDLSNKHYLSMIKRYNFISQGFGLAGTVNINIFDEKLTLSKLLSQITTSIGIIIIALIYLTSFRRVMRFLRREHSRVLNLLSRIPPGVVKKNYPFQLLLLKNKELAKEAVAEEKEGLDESKQPDKKATSKHYDPESNSIPTEKGYNKNSMPPMSSPQPPQQTETIMSRFFNSLAKSAKSVSNFSIQSNEVQKGSAEISTSNKKIKQSAPMDVSEDEIFEPIDEKTRVRQDSANKPAPPVKPLSSRMKSTSYQNIHPSKLKESISSSHPSASQDDVGKLLLDGGGTPTPNHRRSTSFQNLKRNNTIKGQIKSPPSSSMPLVVVTSVSEQEEPKKMMVEFSEVVEIRGVSGIAIDEDAETDESVGDERGDFDNVFDSSEKV